MPSRDEQPTRRKRLLIISLCVAAALVFLYAIAGFWILPRVLEARLPVLVADQLPVTATVGQIELNPFLLTATVRDLSVRGNDGEHLVGLKEIYANLQLSSIFRWAVFFKEVRLSEPDALLQILPDGRINVLALLPLPEESAEKNEDKPLQLPVVAVERFVLEGGKLVLRNLSSTSPFEATIAPIQLHLTDFSTRADSESQFDFSAGTDRGARFSGQVNLMVQPIGVRGSLRATGIDIRHIWEAVADAVNFEITDGRIDLAGEFAAGVGHDGLRMQLSGGRVELKDFSLAAKGDPAPLISIPSLSVTGAGIDLNEQRLRVESVQTEDARIRTWVSGDGSVQLLDVLLPQTAPSGKTPTAPEQKTPPAFRLDEWDLQIDRVAVHNSGIELQDRSLSPPVPLDYEPINMLIENLNNRDNAAASIALDVRDEFGGRFDISGQIGVNPSVADLKVRVLKAALKKAEPYVKVFADVDVADGTVDAEGQVKFTGTGSGPKAQYRGAMRVDNMKIITPADQRDLVKFTFLAINGVQIDLAPNNIRISEIVLQQPQGNLIIEPDGSLNVSKVVATVKKESTEIAESLPGRVVRVIKENIRGPVPVHIDALRVKQASANFEDRSLKPKIAITLEDVEGEMTDISTFEGSPVKVKIDGRIDDSAPLRISGTLLPFGEKTDMDMRVSLKNFRLRSISPYSGKHAGYTIKKGQLSLVLDYRLSEDIIDGKNEIFLRQLMLGERTDSPDAIPLPLDLAVALLKDAEGNIRFDIPMRGNITDPHFSVGNAVADTLIKFVTGIVSSPFKVMAGLAGGFSTEELDHVLFAPGSTAIEDDQAEKLLAVAKALRERPSLEVEIRGRAYVRLDGEAMAAEASATATAQKPAVDEPQLRELARQRAISIRDALVLEGKIDAQRMTILPEKVEEGSADGRAISTLSLTAE